MDGANMLTDKEDQGRNKLFVVSENNHTEKSLKEELERLYVAAGYINAESGNMKIAMHLIGAAIAELESRVGPETPPQIRMVGEGKDKID